MYDCITSVGCSWSLVVKIRLKIPFGENLSNEIKKLINELYQYFRKVLNGPVLAVYVQKVLFGLLSPRLLEFSTFWTKSWYFLDSRYNKYNVVKH